MNNAEIDALLEKYNNGLADASEIRLIETLLEEGLIELGNLEALDQVHEKVMRIETPETSTTLDKQFYNMLSSEKKKQNGFSMRVFFSWPEILPKLSFAAFILLIGFAIGYYSKSGGAASQQVDLLTKEVSGLKEMMMLSLLEKESATERLKAVNLTSNMSAVSDKVTTALLQTLNHDTNINVRLAALDALKPYVSESNVREALIRSIALQESPLVQVALAELMAALHEKSSVKEFEKILNDENTPLEVKKKIEENLNVMI